MRMRWGTLIALGLAMTGCGSRAEVTLPAVFSDNMVLQRGMRTPVWGTAKPGARVTISLDGITQTVAADPHGVWKTALPSHAAGGPFTMTITGDGSTIQYSNVLIGDVWICSGQSNMEMGIANVRNAKEEIARADHPAIRLFTVQKTVSSTPKADCFGKWDVCTPQTVSAGGWGGFTAAGYFFGRELHRKYGVPIGLIHTSWGGTPAESWTRREILTANPNLAGMLTRIPAEEGGKPVKAWDAWTPSSLYNAMIHPLIPFAIKGAIWYQGESNSDRAYQYRTLMPTMIANWRKDWGQGTFPFILVQLANFMARDTEPVDSNWAELREAQTMTLALPKTGMATIIDIGEAGNIHPKDKQDVGKRLALCAMNVAYGDRSVEGFSPMFKAMTKNGSQITLTFTHLGGGLTLGDNRPATGFSIAGADRKFHWANAVISGNKIVVSSPEVPDPLAVRYGWSNNPDVNVYSKDGLPLTPFRTDDFPGLTATKR